MRVVGCWFLSMDSFYGADLLCESISELSFKRDEELNGIDGMFSHVSDSCSGLGFVRGHFIEAEVSSASMEGHEPSLDVDSMAFAEAVVVEPEEEFPVVDLTVDVDAKAMLVKSALPEMVDVHIQVAGSLVEVVVPAASVGSLSKGLGKGPSVEILLLQPLRPHFEAFYAGEDDLSPDQEAALKELEAKMGSGWFGCGRKNASGGRVRAGKFLPADSSFVEALEGGGDNPSKKQNVWAMNRMEDFCF